MKWVPKNLKVSNDPINTDGPKFVKGPNLATLSCVLQDSLMENKHMWYLNSGCSKHMTGDKSEFVNFILKQEGHVTYGDNNKGKILGRGTIGDKNNFLIHNPISGRAQA